MTEITVTELARQLSDFVNRVTWRGEEFVITRGGKPIAALSPVPSSVRVGDLGDVLSALPSLTDNDLDDFEATTTQARKAHNDKLVDPWQS
jgi:prevent-host-death family protein